MNVASPLFVVIGLAVIVLGVLIGSPPQEEQPTMEKAGRYPCIEIDEAGKRTQLPLNYCETRVENGVVIEKLPGGGTRTTTTWQDGTSGVEERRPLTYLSEAQSYVRAECYSYQRCAPGFEERSISATTDNYVCRRK